MTDADVSFQYVVVIARQINAFWLAESIAVKTEFTQQYKLQRYTKSVAEMKRCVALSVFT